MSFERRFHDDAERKLRLRLSLSALNVFIENDIDTYIKACAIHTYVCMYMQMRTLCFAEKHAYDVIRQKIRYRLMTRSTFCLMERPTLPGRVISVVAVAGVLSGR